MKKFLVVAALAVILASPYLLISVSARLQFSGTYKFIFPNYSDRNSVGEPNSICTENIFDLDYLGFVWGGVNNYLNISRPDTIPIHAAVLSGKDMFIFSFREMSFVPLSKETLIYGEVSSCGLKLRPWDTPVSP
ncbi:hypothetical protein [Agrobacterium rosae]|uniref:hypothetical protein n=1 Tax=Agrobacterium rosae TaxID=1972867 RepID=UPI003A801E68